MFYCFRVSKSSDKGGGAEDQDFPSKIICLTTSKNFVGEAFRVSLISVTEKVCEQEGEGYLDCPSNFFCLTVTNFSLRESFSVAFYSGITENRE